MYSILDRGCTLATPGKYDGSIWLAVRDAGCRYRYYYNSLPLYENATETLANLRSVAEIVGTQSVSLLKKRRPINVLFLVTAANTSVGGSEVLCSVIVSTKARRSSALTSCKRAAHRPNDVHIGCAYRVAELLTYCFGVYFRTREGEA